MRLLLALTATLPLAAAVFRDEAYQIDYHHALLGIPEAENTFFHTPNPSSKASLIYTLSEKSLIGAINPKDGAVVWRQRLESAVNSSRALLRPGEGVDLVASATDGEVAAWAAKDGRLVWREEFEEVGQAVSLGFVEKDVVVLHQGAHPVVQRRDGSTGAILWQFGDTRYVAFLRSMEEYMLMNLVVILLMRLPFLDPLSTLYPSTARCWEVSRSRSPILMV